MKKLASVALREEHLFTDHGVGLETDRLLQTHQYQTESAEPVTSCTYYHNGTAFTCKTSNRRAASPTCRLAFGRSHLIHGGHSMSTENFPDQGVCWIKRHSRNQSPEDVELSNSRQQVYR
jgi:hypothetical protein